jgi:hypothetical protein
VPFARRSRLSSLGSSAFALCPALSSICIPSSVPAIRPACFWRCESLAAVTFEPGSRLYRRSVRRVFLTLVPLPPVLPGGFDRFRLHWHESERSFDRALSSAGISSWMSAAVRLSGISEMRWR